MSYADIKLENVSVSEEALEQAKKEYEWKCEAAPGIYRMVWFARDEEQRPAFFYNLDKRGGFKHGIAINYADKRMKKINSILQRDTAMDWNDYLLAEIDQNPILEQSEDAYIYDWSPRAVLSLDQK